jgi:hypothetical protein
MVGGLRVPEPLQPSEARDIRHAVGHRWLSESEFQEPRGRQGFRGLCSHRERGTCAGHRSRGLRRRHTLVEAHRADGCSRRVVACASRALAGPPHLNDDCGARALRQRPDRRFGTRRLLHSFPSTGREPYGCRGAESQPAPARRTQIVLTTRVGVQWELRCPLARTDEWVRRGSARPERTPRPSPDPSLIFVTALQAAFRTSTGCSRSASRYSARSDRRFDVPRQEGGSGRASGLYAPQRPAIPIAPLQGMTAASATGPHSRRELSISNGLMR